MLTYFDAQDILRALRRISHMKTAVMTQLFEDDVPRANRACIASLAIDIFALAKRIGLKVEVWEEDGMGTARGGWVRTATGRIYGFRELEQSRTLGTMGPSVEVTLEEYAEIGPAVLIPEMLAGLGLTAADVFWTPDGFAVGAADV